MASRFLYCPEVPFTLYRTLYKLRTFHARPASNRYLACCTFCACSSFITYGAGVMVWLSYWYLKEKARVPIFRNARFSFCQAFS